MNCISVLHKNRDVPEQKELDLVSEQVTEKEPIIMVKFSKFFKLFDIFIGFLIGFAITLLFFT